MLMTKKELNELINETGKPCVSIIIPTHRVSPGRIQDPDVLSKLVESSKISLNKICDNKNDVEIISTKIDNLCGQVDYVHPKDGIGIFVSRDFSKLVKFPFPVSSKIRTGDSFYLKDILFNFYNVVDYYILDITRKSVRLFKASGEEYTELKDKDFPYEYTEEYEYETSARGNSYSNTLKTFERDKSVLQEIRLKDFLRHADNLLEKYITTETPIVIAGGKKELADYLKTTKHENNIIGKVSGNYNYNGETQLTSHAWTEVQEYVKNQNRILIDELSEKIGRRLAVTGIKEVWKAASEAKGLKLIVEKDFDCHGYIRKDGLELKSSKPAGNNKYFFDPDVVDKVIRIVMDKGGEIVFVDKDALKNFNGIALLLRY
jgi:hypothetical protein